MSTMEKDEDGDVIVQNPPDRTAAPNRRTDVLDRTRLKKPSMYHVIMLNDDFTPMDFVVELLMKVFNHDPAAAHALTMEIHTKGKGIAGTYTFEVAEMKVSESMTKARMAEHPLQVVMEKE